MEHAGEHVVFSLPLTRLATVAEFLRLVGPGGCEVWERTGTLPHRKQWQHCLCCGPYPARGRLMGGAWSRTVTWSSPSSLDEPPIAGCVPQGQSFNWEKGFQVHSGIGLAWQRVAGLSVFGCFKGSEAEAETCHYSKTV